MKTWISLLRGINVGGKNVLPMKELRNLLEKLGYENVRTYIQSGNCVFDAKESNASAISNEIAYAISKKFKIKPSVVTISLAQLNAAIKNNPYDSKKNEPKTIHFFFLSETPKEVDKARLQSLKNESEEFLLKKNIFYLFAPEGIARSKLAAGAEKALGVPTTARNYRTVIKLAELASES